MQQYSPDTVEYTWECIKNIESGTALVHTTADAD